MRCWLQLMVRRGFSATSATATPVASASYPSMVQQGARKRKMEFTAVGLKELKFTSAQAVGAKLKRMADALTCSVLSATTNGAGFVA